MKKWRCTVCNYIHTGEEPPETCPVCGADKSKFVEISEEEAREYESRKKGKSQGPGGEARTEEPAGTAEKQPNRQSTKEERKSTESAGQKKVESSALVEQMNELMVKHHLHPMSVHVPNGVLPVVVLFMFLAAVFASESLAQAAFYFAVFTLLFMPVVWYTGINVWQRKYRGAMTSRFITKLVAAGVVTASLFIIVVWYLFNPDVILAGAARRGGFLILNLIMLGGASVAGYIGGKLVFRD